MSTPKAQRRRKKGALAFFCNLGETA